ncbi:MAG TPA: hypothetical protein VK144_02400 [Bacillota bacterium]|nr:hypothetical protein [Bacillota bacterium]
MERKKIFRRATKHEAQMKRRGAEEFAQEFPEGAFGAPQIESDRNMQRYKKPPKKEE